MLLLLLLCFWFGQGQQSRAKSETPANTQQQSAQNEASPIPQQNAGQSGNQAQQSQSNSAHWSDPIVLLQLLLFFAVAVQAGIYGWQLWVMRRTLREITRQADALDNQVSAAQGQLTAMQGQLSAIERQESVMKNQARTMDAALVLGTRAYVGAHKPRLERETRRIFFYIGNVGKVPAKDIMVVYELRVAIPRQFVKDRQPRKFWGTMAQDPEHWTLRVPFMNSFGERTKLFPGLQIELMIGLGAGEQPYIGDAEYTLIMQGHAETEIRGEIKYSDGFHSGKISDFAFRYFALDDIWIPQTIDKSFEVQPDPEKPDRDYNPS